MLVQLLSISLVPLHNEFDFRTTILLIHKKLFHVRGVSDFVQEDGDEVDYEGIVLDRYWVNRNKPAVHG